jgi:DNA processing protein
MPSDLTEQQAYLALNALPELGPVALNRLLEAFDGEPQAILAADARRLGAVLGGRAAQVTAVRDWRAHFDPQREEAKMAQAGVAFLRRGDRGFPALLTEISDPPVGLYRKGNYEFGSPGVAIVGSRRATAYGQSVARRLAAELAERGYCVVSGLARGIDTAAHEGALEAGGRTAAVLGTGVDIIHPPENLALYRRIAEQGAVLSELPFGRTADADSFTRRSRLLSGICEAVIIVESDPYGGAMATARFAGEQGRLLFAVPGRIDQSTSAGCNQLIKDGATLLTKVEDVLQEIQFLGGLRPAPVRRAPVAAPDGSEGLGPDEARVLFCLRGGVSVGAADLVAQSGLPPASVRDALIVLATRGFVTVNAAGAYGIGGGD